MKKFIFILSFIILATINANAQYKMTYQTNDGNEYLFVDKSVSVADNMEFYTTIVNDYNKTLREIRSQTIGVCVTSTTLVLCSSLAIYSANQRQRNETIALLSSCTAGFSLIAMTIFSIQLGKNRHLAHYQELQLAANGIVITF